MKIVLLFIISFSAFAQLTLFERFELIRQKEIIRKRRHEIEQIKRSGTILKENTLKNIYESGTIHVALKGGTKLVNFLENTFLMLHVLFCLILLCVTFIHLQSLSYFLALSLL